MNEILKLFSCICHYIDRNLNIQIRSNFALLFCRNFQSFFEIFCNKNWALRFLNLENLFFKILLMQLALALKALIQAGFSSVGNINGLIGNLLSWKTDLQWKDIGDFQRIRLFSFDILDNSWKFLKFKSSATMIL